MTEARVRKEGVGKEMVLMFHKSKTVLCGNFYSGFYAAVDAAEREAGHF
jgi:hypothetical protein